DRLVGRFQKCGRNRCRVDAANGDIGVLDPSADTQVTGCDQRGRLTRVGVVEETGDGRQKNEHPQIDRTSHVPLLTALRGKIDGYRKARGDHIGREMTIGEARLHKQRDRHDVVNSLIADDTVRIVPLQQHHFAASVGAVGHGPGSCWGIRRSSVKAPARQPRLTEPPGNAAYQQQSLSIDQEVNREGSQSATKDLDMTKCRCGVGAACRAQVRYDSNFSLWRQVPSQRPRTGGRQRMVADPAVTVAGATLTCRSRSSRAFASGTGGWSTGVVVGLAHTVLVVPKLGCGAVGGGALIWMLVARSNTYTAQIHWHDVVDSGWGTHSEKYGDW